MADFAYTQILEYVDTGFGRFLLSEDGTDGTVFDGDGDDQFETNDMALGEDYQGTVEIDGTTMPVFSDGILVSIYVPASRAEVAPGDIPGTLPPITNQPYMFCFLAGTMIATPEGERAVETLSIGDPILTANGRSVPVRWMGRQTSFPMFAGPRMLPVMIERGALNAVAGGSDAAVPHRDLTVTADHGMMVSDLVIKASALVNGTTIRFLAAGELPQQVTYYHVETEAHDAILAEGASAETFIDYQARQSFDNHAEYEALYGAERLIPEMDRPRISSARLLPDDIRQALGIADDRSAEAPLDAAFERAA